MLILQLYTKLLSQFAMHPVASEGDKRTITLNGCSII